MAVTLTDVETLQICKEILERVKKIEEAARNNVTILPQDHYGECWMCGCIVGEDGFRTEEGPLHTWCYKRLQRVRHED